MALIPDPGRPRMLRNHEAHGPRRMSLCPGAGATAMRSTPLQPEKALQQ